MANWDRFIEAVAIAAYAPKISSSTYEGGTFIRRYTEGEVAAGAANAQELADAIVSLRAYFAEIKE